MTEEQKLQDLADKHAAKKEAADKVNNMTAVERRRSIEDREMAKAGGFDVEELA